jgi:hypothetical protein
VAKSDNIHDLGDGEYGFKCPEPGCEFTSRGWRTKKSATERGDQHLAEHETGEAMAELADSGIDGAVRT